MILRCLTSLVVSTLVTQDVEVSAPTLSKHHSGAIVLPRDLDISSPLTIKRKKPLRQGAVYMVQQFRLATDGK